MLRRTSRVISTGRGHPCRGDADRDQPPAVAHHRQGLSERALAAEHLEDDVRPTPGQLEHAGDGILGSRIDRRRWRRARARRRASRRRGRPRRPRAAPAARATCTIIEPTPPVATTATWSPTRSLAAVRDRAVRRQRGTADDRRLLERQRVGQREDRVLRHDGVLGQTAHRVHRERRSVLAVQTRLAVVERARAGGSARRTGEQRSSRPRAQCGARRRTA